MLFYNYSGMKKQTADQSAKVVEKYRQQFAHNMEMYNCTDKGKKAMMFYCDHWIGSEPYGKYFKEIGLDAIVNPCMSGVELRRVADIPAKLTKEVRLYPYFFPVNLEGKPNFPDGAPVGDCKKYWKGIRRAMLQNPADRIGFGGYLHLAVTSPEFIDYVGVFS